jgi:urease accessory protein UreF
MTGADAESVAEKLAAYMRAQAAWRRALALREARRAAAHRRSADAIEAWAQYVEAPPIDDPNLAAIAAGQAMIGSPPEFRPRGDGGAMIRGHGYPN